jgi:hypothetical protein
MIDQIDQTLPNLEAAFTDVRGRRWTLVLNFSLARRIKTIAGVDFVNYHDGKALMIIQQDVERLVQVLWLLCEEQATGNSIDEEDFGRGLGGDEIEAAIGALEQCLLNFSRPATRPAMVAIADKTREAVTRQTELIRSKVLSQKFDAALEKQLQSTGDKIDRELQKAATSGILPSA